MRRAQEIIRSPEVLREFQEFQRRKHGEVQSKLVLPDKESPNPERRAEKIADETIGTPEKTRETKERTVDPDYGGAQGDARTYLKHQYTNDDGVMFCQLCQDSQPVILNGEPHFEAVDCVSGISFHYEQNNLALCLRIPRDSATDSTVIRPPAPRSSGRVSRSEATQGFQVKVLPCRLSIFLFLCAWFFRSN